MEAMDESDSERLTLTVAQAAKKLGISRASAYQAAANGQLPTLRWGRRIVVPKTALQEMLRRVDTTGHIGPPSSSHSSTAIGSEAVPSRFHRIPPKRPRLRKSPPRDL